MFKISLNCSFSLVLKKYPFSVVVALLLPVEVLDVKEVVARIDV